MQRRTAFLLCLGLGACSTDTFMGDAGMGNDSGDQPDSPIAMDGSKPGPDATPMEAGPPPRFCTSVDAAFCADFDIPNDAAAGFFLSTFSGGFTLTFPSPDAGVAFSKPTVMEVGIPTNSGGHASLNAVVGNPVDAGATTKVTLDLEVFLPVLSMTPPIYAFTFSALGAATSFGLAEAAGSWQLVTQTGAAKPFDTAPATGEWAHANLVIDLSTTSGTATLVVLSSAGKSTAVLTGYETLGTLNSSPPPPYPAQLQLGVSDTTPPNASATIDYDNVIVRLE